MTAVWARRRRVTVPSAGRMEDLLGRRGGPESSAAAVSDSGVVVGTACGRAFRWEAGRVQDLGPDRGGSSAHGVADGVVVGSSWTLTEPPRATRWTSEGLARLPSPPDEDAGVAVAVNSSGLVVGRSRSSVTGTWRAVVWDSEGSHVLPDLGGRGAEATAVNDAGLVVGCSDTREGESRAVYWQDGRLQEIGTLGGTRSEARAVNAQGQVAGSSTTPEGRTHAFLSIGDELRDLGTLGGATSRALGLNDHGQVVGFSTRPGSEEKRAFSWCGGEMTDLGTLRGANSVAHAVNGRGWVVGRASTGAGALSLPLRRGAWSWEAHAVLVRTAG